MVQTFEIKMWLLKRRLTIREVARQAKVSPAYASLTIWGKRRSLRVLRTLKRLGCPAEFLGEAPSPQPSPARGEGEEGERLASNQ